MCFELEWSGLLGWFFFFFLVRFIEWILLHQVQKDISLRRFPQKFMENTFKLSVRCGWVNRGNPNHVHVLSEAFGAKLTCCKHGSACRMKGWRKSAFTQGNGGNGRNCVPSVQNPQWVFSWCGYNLVIFFQNILFCTNLLKQLYIHFQRTIYKKKIRERRHNGLGWISFQCT